VAEGDCSDEGVGLWRFGITLSGEWLDEDKDELLKAVKAIGGKFSQEDGGTAWDVFRSANNSGVDMEYVDNACPEGCWGRTISSQHIRFYGPSRGALGERLVVHELGHAFNRRVENVLGNDASPNSSLDNEWRNNPVFPRRDDEHNGFAGGFPGWQQSTELDAGNEFADMFIGWVYGKWENHAAGVVRSNWMNQEDHMPLWVSELIP
jgi:hypothetical protein